MRGTGRNFAVANAGNIKSNTASYLLKIRPGIISDCATLIGRVFVDKNFDGEQQPGEPGIPNAVVYMDDGNHIVTDANGLFSLANVISGDRFLPADGRSAIALDGKIIDEDGEIIPENVTVTLTANAGKFVGADQDKDASGFQVLALAGKFTATLQSSLEAQRVQIRAAVDALEDTENFPPSPPLLFSPRSLYRCIIHH